MTFTNVNNNATASNGVQVAEVQLLGSLIPVKPGIVQEPAAAEVLMVGGTLHAGVAASGAGPLSYQWYFDASQPIANATNATLTLANLQTTNSGSYTCVISNPYGSTNSAPLSLTVVVPSAYQAAVLADQPLAFWPLSETSGTTAYDYMSGYNGVYLEFSDVGAVEPARSVFIPACRRQF